MSQVPLVSICTRCEDDDDTDAGRGELLYDNVKALRKKLGLKELFDVERVKCMSLCDTPCNVMFEGKKRSTYTRTRVHAVREVEAVVFAARAYAELEPGEELPERKLPGIHAD